MKIKSIALLFTLWIVAFTLQAQDEEKEESPLVLSGSVDTYYKYDFSGEPNIGTSFGEDHNSVSLGMVNLIASKEVGKVSFVGDISFGPRGQTNTIPDADGTGSFHIQNLYVSYALSDAVSVTAGYMGTFVGYEVISPTANFNYSTSYLFTNGPFQNAGIKFDFALADNLGLMVGVFNDWNVYTDNNDLDDIGAQLSYSPTEGFDMYLNFITSANADVSADGDPLDNGTEIDLTAGYQISSELYVGLNAANWSREYSFGGTEVEESFTGVALYGNYAFSSDFALGARLESFTTNNTTSTAGVSTEADGDVFAVTISGNVGSGPLKFIPEIRFDSSGQDIFVDGDGNPTGSAVQFLAGAVFSF